MRRQVSGYVAKGFTLVELLIVVIIVAILAAIVVPQFNSSTTDAKEAALDSNLQAIRAAMELYKAQHGVYPGAKASQNGACTDENKRGTATTAGNVAFVEQLTKASNADGGTCGLSDAAEYKYGPYLRTGMPNNPITNKGSAATEIDVTATGGPITPVAKGGWAVDTKSGQFIANDSSTPEGGGKAYSAH